MLGYRTGIMARLDRTTRKTNTEVLSGAEGRLVQSLARGLSVLRAFRPGEPSLSNAEIAARTALARPTVSRLTETLAALGYLTFLPRTGRYELGAAVVALSHSLLAGMPHRIAARPYLQEIADATRLPASIGMQDGREMILIETARHPEARPARFDLGARLPIATTAMGRAWLFAQRPEVRQRLLDSLRAEVSAADWALIQARIETAFESLRQRGFCMSLGDRRADVYAVGAPVLTPDGPVLALTSGGLPSEVSAERLETDIGPRLATAARRLSTETLTHA